MAVTPAAPGHSRGDGAAAVGAGRLGLIVAGSLATGLIAALLLIAAPFISPEESAVTGAMLCGFSVGWALLAILSARYTDQPLRWAAAPALFMGLGGGLLIALGSPAHAVLNWIWPPALLALVIWMFLRVRRQPLGRGARSLLYLVFALLLIASLGGGYQTVREAADANAFPMPGQLVDVSGHRLHLNCTGTGSPTVVLQPGGGDFSSVMAWIAPGVAADTRVCVYDRAGRGWSERSDSPQDASQISAELHNLLQHANIPGPYVLAGHSFGGLYALAHAQRYPADVAGMVLIDSTNPATTADPARARAYDSSSADAITDRVAALGAAAARLGLLRLLPAAGYADLPSRARDEVAAKTCTADYATGWINEFVQASASGAEAAMLTDFGDKPLVVLTAGAESDATHDAAQNKLATLSKNSSHRVIDGASHIGLITDQQYAKATIQAILDVVTAVRTNHPLVK